MLRVRELACHRGGKKIFENLSFEVNSGDALSVIGPNGSGKSSLLRVLAGLLESSAGAVEWMQKKIHEDRTDYCGAINYISHQDAAKNELTVRELLDYWRALRPAATDKLERSDPFGVVQYADRPVRFLSAGQRRKLALTRLVLYPAKLWLLDEPTTSLDAEGQIALSRIIADHRAEGGLAVIATHQDLAMSSSRQLVLGMAK